MWPNSNDTMHRPVADGVKSFPEQESEPQKTNLTRGEINPHNSSTTKKFFINYDFCINEQE